MSTDDRTLPDDESRRVGGYTEAEFDREFVRSERSDAFTLATRAITLVVVYALIARAVLSGHLTAGLLWLPIGVEFVAMMWIGYAMSKWVIDCPAFTKSSGRFGVVLAWSLFVAGIVVARLAWDPAQGKFDTAQIEPSLADAWHRIRTSYLHYAMAAALIGLMISTIPEILRWRRERGVFVWASTMQSGFRLGVIFLMSILGVFVAAFLGGFFGEPDTWNWTWLTFAFLLTAEILTLAIAAAMHRDVKRKAAAAAKGAPAGAA